MKYLIIHSTHTQKGRDITVDDVVRTHVNELEFDNVAFHDMILRNGKIENLTAHNRGVVPSWGLLDISKSKRRHVAYVGGLDEEGDYFLDSRTKQQKTSLEIYVKYFILRHPEVKICSYTDVSKIALTNASFDVPKWLKSIGIKEINIYNEVDRSAHMEICQ